MGIPIKKYIDISTTALNTQGADRDFSGLLFTNIAMLGDVPAAYDEIKEKYDDGEVVGLDLEGVNSCFAAGNNVTDFAAKYFGYQNEFGISPARLNIVKFSGSLDATVFTNVIKKFSNFVGFTMLESGMKTVAEANAALGRQYAYLCDGDVPTPSSIQNFSGSHFMKTSTPTDIAYPMAWIATRDYTRRNGAGTIDYTEFPGATPTVEDGTTKDALDAERINYIGKVQQRGIERAWYQRGVNMDGMDLGVYCDCVWMQSEIEAGWINLALGATKIPANESGMMRVRAMIVDVAERGIENGCILLNKPLTTTQVSEINQFAGDESAADSVQTNGYYINTRLLQDEKSKWVVQYTLIYSKGDHIEKIVGTHLLV